MTSSALTYWQSHSSDRLDELLAAHKLMEGTGRGRRWRTEGLNAALVLRLAAEFQSFARRLHDVGCDTFAIWAAPTNVAVGAVIRNQLREARQIDRRNAQPASLGSDFGRFGFELWPALRARDARSERYQESLERLNTARNAVAHAHHGALADLRAEGYPITLEVVRRWHRHLNGLADMLDIELATQLARLFSQQSPW